MKNKAFTLVELLGVIVILGIIAMITTPIVQRTIIENTEKAYEEQVDSFERAAKNYVAKHPYKMASQCSPNCQVTLKTLQEEGFLPSGNIKNPKTDEYFKLDNKVIITYNNSKFSYNYDKAQDE